MLHEVAAGVWVTQSRLYRTTSTVIVGPDGDALVVDPAVTAADLESLAAQIHAHGWRIRAGFSTHPHWDHLLWSPVLGDVPRWALPAAVAVATARRAELLAEAAADLVGQRRCDDGGAPLDVDSFGLLTALADGAEALPWSPVPAVVRPLAGHAPGSAALLLPEERTLVVGDMVSDVEVPLLDLDATDPLTDYVGALEEVAMLVDSKAVEVLIPGHGQVADRAEARRRLALDRTYLADLQALRPGRDPRLAPGWLLDAHLAQAQALAARRSPGGARAPRSAWEPSR